MKTGEWAWLYRERSPWVPEAVWFPTALLPSQGVRWTAVDDSTGGATLGDGGNTVSLRFRFNEAGEAVSVSTPGRNREVNGSYELTPWSDRFGNYEVRNGVRIPPEAEVEWRTGTVRCRTFAAESKRSNTIC